MPKFTPVTVTKIKYVRDRLQDVSADEKLFAFARKHVKNTNRKNRFFSFCKALKPGVCLEDIWEFDPEQALLPSAYYFSFMVMTLRLTFELLLRNDGDYGLLVDKPFPDGVSDVEYKFDQRRPEGDPSVLRMTPEVWSTISDAIGLLIREESGDPETTQFFQLWKAKQYIDEQVLRA